jgi:mevalonate kinase
MGDVVVAAREAMLAGDWATVGDLVNIHQGLLDSLNVNSPQLANLIFSARDAGALGAKLSGAGGGDCMFAIVDAETRSSVASAIQQEGTLVEVETGVPGVRIETSR